MGATSLHLEIYLIRHGETAWSLTGQHTGVTEVPLTPRGQEMAAQLIPMLRDIVFTRVLTSPRQRARQTCELAQPRAFPEIESNLADWDYGAYEGLRSAEIRFKNPQWKIWRDGCPGGETPAQVSDRADRLIKSLAISGGRVALFSHGHFGRVLAARWIEMPISLGQRLVLDPASISILGFDSEAPPARAICRWNAAPILAPR